MLNKRPFIIALFVSIFAVSILLTAVVGLTFSFVRNGFGSDKSAVTPAPVPRLSENLREELNAALAPEFAFNFETAGNPFADRTGLSGASKTMPGGVTTNLPKMTGNERPLIMPGNNTMGNPPEFSPLTSSTPNPVVFAPDTAELLKERNRQKKMGNAVAPEAEVYSIDEVLPYGIVGSGKTNRVKLFAPKTKARFSVSRGTRFRDGVIEAIDDEGASFRRDGSGEIVYHRWAKNTDKTPAGKNSADSPILRRASDGTNQ